VFPFKYVLEIYGMKETFVARGKQFADYVYAKIASHVDWNGPGLETNDGLQDQVLFDRREYWKPNT
jgi:hypothetical protein